MAKDRGRHARLRPARPVTRPARFAAHLVEMQMGFLALLRRESLATWDGAADVLRDLAGRYDDGRRG